jgi:hypothetical protein
MPQARDVVQVMVAAWGPAFGYPRMPVFDGEQFANQGPELEYNERAKVVVEATPSTTLGEIIDQAAMQFGVLSQNERTVSEQVPCVAFFQKGDQAGTEFTSDRWCRAIRTIDPLGSPSWTVRWSEISLKELVATSSAGLLDGDPLRPYFWPVIPQGNLAEVAVSIWMMWVFWEHYLSARETVGIAKRILERIRCGKTAVEENHEAWRRWLRRPQVLMPYLDSAPRTTTEIATDTGISESQLEGILWGMGYVLGQDERWRLGEDPPSKVLQAGVMDIKKTGHGPEDMDEGVHRIESLVEAAKREDQETL